MESARRTSLGAPWWPGVLVVALALVASTPGLWNSYSYDDVPVVLNNPRVHSIASPDTYFREAYWPPGHGASLYRPVTVQFFSVQWALGGGSPVAFHATSIILYAATVLATYLLAATMLPVMAAVGAAALFAVHPVHVEAVGGVVGQAELLCTLATILAVIVYIKARARGQVAPIDRIALVGLALLAALSKEQGFMLPGLLLLVELVVVPASGWDQARRRAVASAIGPVFLVLAVAFAARTAVLGGMGGGAPAFGLRGIGFPDRAVTFLALVPEWLRLLAWPAHLRVEYSPPEFSASTSIGAKELLGLALLCGLGALAWRARRTSPAVTVGLGWIAIALAPVTNLFFTTGVIIAERTLFLPSVGMVLAAVGAWVWIASRWPRHVPVWTGPGLLALLVLAGTVRSASRQRIWRDSSVLHAQSVVDSPQGYRAHFMYGITLLAQDSLARAEGELRRAADLYVGDYRVYEELTQVIRRQRGCRDALPFMRQALALDSSLTLSRSRLYFCHLELGEPEAARDVARQGERMGLAEFKSLRQRAESLLVHPGAGAR